MSLSIYPLNILIPNKFVLNFSPMNILRHMAYNMCLIQKKNQTIVHYVCNTQKFPHEHFKTYGIQHVFNTKEKSNHCTLCTLKD